MLKFKYYEYEGLTKVSAKLYGVEVAYIEVEPNLVYIKLNTGGRTTRGVSDSIRFALREAKVNGYIYKDNHTKILYFIFPDGKTKEPINPTTTLEFNPNDFSDNRMIKRSTHD